MDDGATAGGVWPRRLKKLAVSAFLVVHLGATLAWVLPECPLRVKAFPVVSWYIQPLGLWHYWGMFAPDPVRDTCTLEAEAVDARGLRHLFAFPKLADYSKLAGVPRFRHSKFAANLAIRELDGNREVAARHVVRQLNLPAEAFPVEVCLRYQVRPTPPPGGPPADPMAPTFPFVLGTFRFPDRREVFP